MTPPSLQIVAIPTTTEAVKKTSPPQRGWHICRSACCGSRTPAGCNILLH